MDKRGRLVLLAALLLGESVTVRAALAMLKVLKWWGVERTYMWASRSSRCSRCFFSLPLMALSLGHSQH